jgi:Endonuclease-reverse transcriptase
MEAIGLSVQIKNNTRLDFFSVFCPHGNLNKEDLVLLMSTSNHSCIIGGDLNAHHSLWERNSRHNRAGNAVVDFLANEDEMILITPKLLGTRVNPSTGSTSTIDLTMVSPDLEETT